MNSYLDPFLDRFRNPIVSSIVVSFFLTNFDLLIPLISAIFHPKELSLFGRVSELKDVLCKEFLLRVLFPFGAGIVISLLALPAIDWGYAWVIAHFDRRRLNSITLATNKEISKQLSFYNLLSRELIFRIENNSIIEAMKGFESGANCYIFRFDHATQEGMIVNYNKNTQKLCKANLDGQRVGLFYKKLGSDFALVVPAGILIDQDYINKYYNNLIQGSVKVAADGYLENTNSSMDSVGNFEISADLSQLRRISFRADNKLIHSGSISLEQRIIF